MITLHTFGPAFDLPDPSPFVAKALMLLKMSGLEYREQTADVTKAPKKKLPVMDDGGTIVADSSFIRIHLEQNHGINFSGGYGQEDLAKGWAIEKMLEEHFYWLIAYTRWMDDANFDKGPRHFFAKVPAVMRPAIIWMVRREVRKNLHGQGLGRHSIAELTELARRDAHALSVLLGEKPYTLGDRRCGFDATTFAFVQSALCPLFDHPISNTLREFPNLQAYCDRMSAEFLGTRKD
ncbi:MAG: glutathione S-transferase family protein [Pseudomonadota bacterium]